MVSEDIELTHTEFNSLLQESVSSWQCTNGHTTRVWLTVAFMRPDGPHMMGGSSWDMCDNCEEIPSKADLIRMPREIADKVNSSPENTGWLLTLNMKSREKEDVSA